MDSINFNYIEIDGAFINDSDKAIKIDKNKEDIIAYPEICVNSYEIKKANNESSFIYEVNIPEKNNNEIIIPEKNVVLLQTKLECPFIQLDPRNVDKFNELPIPFEKMKKELAVVLYKLI